MYLYSVIIKFIVFRLLLFLYPNGLYLKTCLIIYLFKKNFFLKKDYFKKHFTFKEICKSDDIIRIYESNHSTLTSVDDKAATIKAACSNIAE